MAEANWRQGTGPLPPPGATGHIPATKLKSEISDRRVEPPLCVQNAMLTKDKKPFTYTPGGIDLSEIRSPRMARRLERNAMSEGVSPTPPTHPHYPSGPLPPSALAAMQPQLQVQVFPTGGIPQPHHGGPPPPPPPPSGIPPPPKAPPMQQSASPLPKDAFERPDMTKIIPENPMAMLRKTSGPVIKRDPIFNKNTYANDDVDYVQPQPQVQIEQRPITPVRQPSTESPKASTGVGSIYIPPISNQTTQPQRQISNQAESPMVTPNVAPPYYKRQPTQLAPEPQSPKSPQSPQNVSPKYTPPSPQTPDSPKPSLNKAPTPWLTQRRQQSQEVPEWAVNDQREQLSPPVKVQDVQEPLPTQPSVPWRQQQQEQREPQYSQPESHPWQQRQKQPEPQYRPVEDQFQQERPTQNIPQGGGVRRQMQPREMPQETAPVQRTEIVIVNDPPQVFQHPGQPQQRVVNRQQPLPNNYQQQQQAGVRIIPVQVEGATSNGTSNNSDGRSFNRQLSWNSTPTQSNTFKVLQKITQTDGDDDDGQIAIEHSPKMTHQFPQRQVSVEQMRKQPNSVSQSPQNSNRGPKVRTIPIDIERDESTKPYIPPSEQIVQEPKKYMGSSIPSRSFKILQAMTAPNDCGPGQSDL